MIVASMTVTLFRSPCLSVLTSLGRLSLQTILSHIWSNDVYSDPHARYNNVRVHLRLTFLFDRHVLAKALKLQTRGKHPFFPAALAAALVAATLIAGAVQLLVLL